MDGERGECWSCLQTPTMMEKWKVEIGGERQRMESNGSQVLRDPSGGVEELLACKYQRT